MTIEKQTTKTYCLNVVWDDERQAKGAAFYEQDVIRDDGVIISVKQGDAQPVAVPITRASMSQASSVASGGTPCACRHNERRRTARRCKPTCNASPASVTAIRSRVCRAGCRSKCVARRNRSVKSAEADHARAHRCAADRHRASWPDDAA